MSKSNETTPNVPILRFKQFQDNWSSKRLSDIAEVVGGGTPDTTDSTLWNGGIQWFTPTEVGHSKYVSMSARTISQLGLQKSSAKILPAGSILLSSRATVGECSITQKDCTTNQGFQNLIPKKGINNEFLYYLAQTQKRHFIKYASGSTFLEISNSEIKKTKCAVPSIEEQTEIATFLSAIDRKIEVQNKIISKYETLIKGLKNQLYSRKARFTSHNKIPFPKWEKKQLSEILSISTEKNGSQYSKEKVLSVSDEYGVVNQIKFQGKSFAGQDISNYKVVKSGQIIYTRSPLAAKPFGIIKIVGNEIGIVSPLYIVNTVNNGYDALFIFYLFDTPQSTNNYLKPLVRVGAKHTMNISNDEWLSGTVIIPCLEEQKMIAGVLQSIDKKISFEKKVLEILKEQKTYLLSKMFI